MRTQSEPDDPPAVKDEDAEHPIAGAWRPMLREVVSAFARGDYALEAGIPGVAAVAPHVSAHIRDYIADYGEVLVELSDETWESSCAQWMGDHWDVLIDLWTEGEGRSDLVLTGKMTETDSGPRFTVGLVYVP